MVFYGVPVGVINMGMCGEETEIGDFGWSEKGAGPWQGQIQRQPEELFILRMAPPVWKGSLAQVYSLRWVQS